MAGGQEQGEKAEGFAVRVTVECKGQDDRVWSITSNEWYGVSDEYTMNTLANMMVQSVLDTTKGMNEFKYGPHKETPSQVKR